MIYEAEREIRIQVLEDTLQTCEGSKMLLEAIGRTRQQTVFYPQPPAIEEQAGNDKEAGAITVTGHSLTEEAGLLHEQFPAYRIGILNAASTIYPGGNVLRGGETEEESLCRCTTLYPCLNTEELLAQYYGRGEAKQSLSDSRYIYTPGIVCIRRENEHPWILEERDWFTVDVISFDRLCIGNMLLEGEHGQGDITMFCCPPAGEGERRIAGALQVAIQQGVEAVVLGAPDSGQSGLTTTLAAVYGKVLKQYAHLFREIRIALNCVTEECEQFAAALSV